MLDHGLPNHFSVACEYCDMSHDYYQAELQIVSLPWVHSKNLVNV